MKDCLVKYSILCIYCQYKNTLQIRMFLYNSWKLFLTDHFADVRQNT